MSPSSHIQHRSIFSYFLVHYLSVKFQYTFYLFLVLSCRLLKKWKIWLRISYHYTALHFFLQKWPGLFPYYKYFIFYNHLSIINNFCWKLEKQFTKKTHVLQKLLQIREYLSRGNVLPMVETLIKYTLRNTTYRICQVNLKNDYMED